MESEVELDNFSAFFYVFGTKTRRSSVIDILTILTNFLNRLLSVRILILFSTVVYFFLNVIDEMVENIKIQRRT